MKIFVETPRLILRELFPGDDEGMLELDSDPEVHRYLGNNSIANISQARETISFIRQQYVEFGIGRWAATKKQTGEFIGWAGLKYITNTVNGHSNFYDIGYRFIKRYWSKGYATECARASLQYGFEQLGLKTIYGVADVDNTGSNHVLKKIGLTYINTFDLNGIMHNWYEISV